MENMENMEAKDIYYLEIKNNKRFKGIYVNEAVMLENEAMKEEIYEGFTETDKLIDEIKKLNIDNDLKRHLLRRELEMFRLKCELKDLKVDFELLKRDLLGTEDDNIDIDKVIDEDQ